LLGCHARKWQQLATFVGKIIVALKFSWRCPGAIKRTLVNTATKRRAIIRNYAK